MYMCLNLIIFISYAIFIKTDFIPVKLTGEKVNLPMNAKDYSQALELSY